MQILKIRLKNIRFYFIFFILIGHSLFFSCQSNHSPKVEVDANNKDLKIPYITPTTLKNVILLDSINEYFKPPIIDFQTFSTHHTTLPFSFSPDQAMQSIFVNNYFYVLTNNNDTIKTALWRNKNFPLKPIADTYSEDKLSFPDTTKTYDTRYLNDTTWIDEDGKKYTLVSFSTSIVEYENLILVGRFNCAFLGIALFEQSINGFQLIDHNLGIACYGSFSHAPPPNLVKIGANKYAIKMEQVNGGAGGPFYGQIFLHSLEKGNRLLFSETLTKRIMDKDSSWDSKIMIDSLSGNEFYDFKLITKGNLMRDSFENVAEDIETLPPLLLERMAKSDLATFSWTRKYIFKNGSYIMVTENIE